METWDIKTFYESKWLTQNAIYAPLEIINDPIQGYMIRALKDIPQLTFLCEYSGNVRTWRETIGSKNDSIMILLDTPSADTSLSCICSTHANLGKYFSGINNHSKESLAK